MIPRSYLYVPGQARDKLAKVRARGADAVIVDLEDAVPPAAKDTARAAVAQWLRQQPPVAGSERELWVRVNPGPLGHQDIAAVVGPALHGVIVAKAESAQDLERVDQELAAAEAASGREPGAIQVVPLLESAAAVLGAQRIAAAPRVVRLQVGEADLAADAGIAPGEDEREWGAIRTQTVLASAAAGIMPPVGPVSTNFQDLERFRESTLALRRQGFVGRACIHPAQLPVVHEVFTPTPEAVTTSRELVAAYDAALAAGEGVFVGEDGRMVDEAVVRQARRVLNLSR